MANPSDFILLDFETASSAQLVSAPGKPGCGAWVYADDPTTEIICLYWSRNWDDRGSWIPERDGMDCPDELASAVEHGITFCAHGAAFEKAIWRTMLVEGWEWPDIPNEQWDDTLATCAMKALPLALDRANNLLNLSHKKDMAGNRAMKSLSRFNKQGYLDRSPEVLDKTYNYCNSDIDAQLGLYKRVGSLTSDERNVWLLDQTINERGVMLDMPLVHAAQQVVDRASIPLQEEFRELTGGINATQRAKVKDWIEGEGVTCDNMQKEYLEDLIGVRREDDDSFDPDRPLQELPDHVRRAIEIRMILGSASIKKLAAMRACVGRGNRVRGLLQYHAASPGRWAGRLFQPQNLPRPSFKADPEELVAAIMSGNPDHVESLYGPPVEAVATSLRHMMIAGPGKEFVVGDFAQIEARIVLALAGQWDKVELLASGGKIYEDMAEQIYKRPINKDDDPEERQVGKNSVLGLGFQMGAAKFRARYAPNHPLSFAKEVVRVYREDFAPEVPKVWEAIEGAALRAVMHGKPTEAYGTLYQLEDGWLTARLPSGRKLWYYNPVPIKKAMPWDDTDIRPAWTYQSFKMGQLRTVDFYGGLGTENVVQGLARDLLVHALQNCERENFFPVLTVHDETVNELKIGTINKETLEEVMNDMPQWGHEMRIPIETEAWVGQRYRK